MSDFPILPITLSVVCYSLVEEIDCTSEIRPPTWHLLQLLPSTVLKVAS